MDEHRELIGNKRRKSPPAKPRARRILTGLLIAVAVLAPVIAAGGYLASRNLGRLAGSFVRSKVAESLNGRLEYSRLELDLAGRAVFHDAQVFPEGAEQPVLTCRKAVVTMDPLTLFGPNRGRKAIVIELSGLKGSLTREADGRFDLARLVKPRPEKESVGVVVRFLDEAEVSFTDLCLLDQAYPQLKPKPGLGPQLLKELGYTTTGPAETEVHSEVLGLSGSLTYNEERRELVFDAAIRRAAPGGRIEASGSALSDGSRFSVDLSLDDATLASGAGYLHALFPRLALPGPGAVQPQPAPSASGRVASLKAKISKEPLQDAVVTGQATLEQLRLTSKLVPPLSFPRLKLDLGARPMRLGTDLELEIPGATLKGRPGLNLDNGKLKGALALQATDLPALLAAAGFKPKAKGGLPLAGRPSAEIELSGSLDKPSITARLGGGNLRYGKLDLGRLAGTASLEGKSLALEGVRLRGGKAPLSAQGRLDLARSSGKLALSLGPLDAAQALDLYARLAPGGTAKPPRAKGPVTLSADLSLRAGKPDVLLSLAGRDLTIEGYSLPRLQAAGRYTAGQLKLQEAEATLSTGKPITLAGYKSDGPLKLSLRAGGTISTKAGAKQSVSLVGKGSTLNLAPEQAHFSFKLAGPANDPELKLQLKTVQNQHPLAINASGHLREGYSPFKADLDWDNTRLGFDGKLDFKRELIDGKLTADNVDLRRFVQQDGLAGEVDAEAKLGGSFKQPSLSGKLSAKRVTYALERRSYAITDASASFKLVKNSTLSVDDGKFKFDEMAFTADGVLGKQESVLNLSCANFNLFRALAPGGQAPAGGGKSAYSRPPLEIKSSGPLSVRLSGKLDNPLALITYSSNAGSVEGHAFDGATLKASASKSGLKIDSFKIDSKSGNVAAKGEIAFAGAAARPAAQPQKKQAGLLGLLAPRRIAAQAVVPAAAPAARQTAHELVSHISLTTSFENFDVAVLTPLAGVPELEGLSGRLNGTLAISGAPDDISADGELVLKDGRYRVAKDGPQGGVAISEARATVSSGKAGITLSNGLITAENTALTFSGTLGHKLNETKLAAQAESVELALLAPFLPPGVPALSGKASLDLDLTPSEGRFPNFVATVNGKGQGLKVGEFLLSSLEARASLRGDKLELERCKAGISGQSLDLSGTFDLSRLPRNGAGDAPVPLKLKLKTEGFNLAELKKLFPEEESVARLSGRLSCDLALRGTSKSPLASGTAELQLASLPEGLPVKLSSLTIGLKLDNNSFTIQHATLQTAGQTLAGAQLTGTGELSLAPAGLKSGDLSLLLAPRNEYLQLAVGDPANPQAELFDGTIGGAVNIRGSFDLTKPGGLTISTPPDSNASEDKDNANRLRVTAPSGKSIITYPVRKKGQASGQSGVKFDKLVLELQPGTRFRYSAYNLQAELSGTLVLSGDPGIQDWRNPNAVRISGNLVVPQGTIGIYRHEIRLDAGGHLTFSGQAGELAPIYSGRGALVLPRILTGNEEVQASNPGAAPGTSAHQDLTVYFNFSHVKLDPEQPEDVILSQISLSSDPPLSPAVIQRLLLGSAAELLAGEGTLGAIAQGEALGYGSSFISRAIEKQFGLDQFSLGGTGSSENPYYMQVEKQVTPEISLSYLKDFYSTTGQSEEFGAKFNLFKQNKDPKKHYQNVDLKLNVKEGGISGGSSSVMFVWSTNF